MKRQDVPGLRNRSQDRRSVKHAPQSVSVSHNRSVRSSVESPYLARPSSTPHPSISLPGSGMGTRRSTASPAKQTVDIRTVLVFGVNHTVRVAPTSVFWRFGNNPSCTLSMGQSRSGKATYFTRQDATPQSGCGPCLNRRAF